MKVNHGTGWSVRVTASLAALVFSLVFLCPIPSTATPVGQSTLLGDLDYSDTFTVNTANRTGSFHYTNPDAADAYYDVESGSPSTQWHPTQNFSFNIAGNTVGEYPGSSGNPGALTGLAQSGGGVFNFAYGIRDSYIIQADATFVGTDQIRLGSYASVGAQTGSANSLTVIFRRGAISLHNGTETATGFTTGIGAGDTAWHNYAVAFDKPGKTISFFVDETFKGMLDLTSFAGGLYQTYASAAVGAGVGGYVGWIDNFQIGAPRDIIPATLIAVQRTEKMDVTEPRAIGTLIDAGRVIKQGAGTLSVTNAYLYNGAVEVEAGTLDIRSGISDLPTALRTGLAFWVDADRNVETAGGEVTAWYDVRELSGGTAYPRARKYGTDPAPTWVQGGDDVAGHKLVDFGAYGGGQWLQWQDAAGSRLCVTNIRTVFVVVSCTNGYGFLLGDWDSDSAIENSGAGDFHAGGNTTAGNPAGVALKDATWWNGSASSAVRNGRTFVDGNFVCGDQERVSSLGEVMSLAAEGDCRASNFGNNRNFKASQGIEGVDIDRQGGGRIGEVLIYSTVLTESQRRMVESFLMKKWLRRDLGIVRVAKGATLTLGVDGTRDLTTAQVSGAGTLNVVGTGQLLVSALADQVLPPLRLQAGASVNSGTLAQRADQPFLLEGGSVYAVSNGISERQSLSDAALIEKTGSGTLTAAAIAPGVRRIAVKAGALRLAPPLPDAPGALSSALGNASFETFTSFGTGGEVDWGYTPTGTGWTIRGDMSSESGADWSGVGMAQPASGVPWCAVQSAPDGDWCVFLKRAGELERTFDLPVPGRYEIAFYTAARPAPFNAHLYQVIVDVTNIIGSVRTKQTDFTRVTCVTPVLAAGTHTLCFKGINESSDRASVIDAIDISPCLEADYVAIPNSGFEETFATLSYAGGEGSSSYYDYFNYNPAGASWSFFTDPAVTNSGITAGTTPWHYTQMKHGGQSAFLRQTGELSIPVTFPTSGVYRLSFKAAARTGNWWLHQFAWYNGHDFAVSLGGVQVARVATWKPSFENASYILPVIKDGDPLTQTLAFTGLNSYGGDRASLIDDVGIYRLQPLANPGFETSATLSNITWEAGITNAGWEFCGGVADRSQSGIARTPSDWGNTAPEGDGNAFLQMKATIRQTFTFDTGGTYTLSFLAAGRAQNNKYLNHDFQVTFNGLKVGYVQAVDGIFRRYSFRLPLVKANAPCVLAFEGLNLGDEVDRASFIDSVMLTKDVEPEFDAAAFAKTELELTSGTSLELDYDGLVILENVCYDGHTYAGVLSADNTPFIRGVGQLYAAPKGTMFFLR